MKYIIRSNTRHEIFWSGLLYDPIWSPHKEDAESLTSKRASNLLKVLRNHYKFKVRLVKVPRI